MCRKGWISLSNPVDLIDKMPQKQIQLGLRTTQATKLHAYYIYFILIFSRSNRNHTDNALHVKNLFVLGNLETRIWSLTRWRPIKMLGLFSYVAWSSLGDIFRGIWSYNRKPISSSMRGDIFCIFSRVLILTKNVESWA